MGSQVEKNSKFDLHHVTSNMPTRTYGSSIADLEIVARLDIAGPHLPQLVGLQVCAVGHSLLAFAVSGLQLDELILHKQQVKVNPIKSP